MGKRKDVEVIVKKDEKPQGGQPLIPPFVNVGKVLSAICPFGSCPEIIEMVGLAP